MLNIDFNDIVADDNEIWITLANYSANIGIFYNTRGIYYRVKILKDDEGKIRFYFRSFEDALMYTKMIQDFTTLEDMVETYERYYKSDEFEIKDKQAKGNIIPPLSKELVDELIAKYYGNGKSYLVTASHTEELNYLDELEVDYFITEHVNNKSFKQKNTIPLTDGDLANVFRDYLMTTGLELTNFDIIIENNTYKGVKLYAKRKIKKYLLRPNER